MPFTNTFNQISRCHGVKLMALSFSEFVMIEVMNVESVKFFRSGTGGLGAIFKGIHLWPVHSFATSPILLKSYENQHYLTQKLI